MNINRTFFIICLISVVLTACTNNSPFVLPESPLGESQEESQSKPELSPTTKPAQEEPAQASDTKDASAESVAASDQSASPTPEPTVEPTPEPVDAFVRRQGSTLMLNGEPFRFIGTNAFFLQPEMVYGHGAVVEETLDKAVDAGFNVVRMWGFNDKDPSIDPAAIQTEPGQFNEKSLVALDSVVALAKERDLRLILPLVNNWQDYGGIPRYLEWCDCGAQHGDFYTNETMMGWYRDYVTMLLTRVNTETGIAYRDEPTILAWELGNELRDKGNNATNLLAWHTEMAALIKSIDPNHLVADGGEGFDDDPSPYPGMSNNYPVRGADGASYHRIATIEDIDMVSYHLYPEYWQLDPINDGVAWIRGHEAIAKQAGKVAYMGEFGITGPDATRASIYKSWLETALVEAQSAGALVWNLVYDSRPNSDGFNIYCPADVETCAVLQR